MFVEERIKALKHKILVLGLSKEETVFIENHIISKSLPLLKQYQPSPPHGISPLRMFSLLIIANSLMEFDLENIVNNFFGGNNQLVSIFLDAHSFTKFWT